MLTSKFIFKYNRFHIDMSVTQKIYPYLSSGKCLLKLALNLGHAMSHVSNILLIALNKE